MDIEKLKCGICSELICRPVSTPCGHNFCELCIIEIMKKSIYNPRCPNCKQKIIGKFEINKLIELVIMENWQKQYKKRLQDPGYVQEINIYAIWIVSVLKTVRTISVLLLPIFIFAILYRHVSNFPRMILKLIRIIVKISTYKSTSLLWQLLWAIMHMIIKYIEATSVLSNITN